MHPKSIFKILAFLAVICLTFALAASPAPQYNLATGDDILIRSSTCFVSESRSCKQCQAIFMLNIVDEDSIAALCDANKVDEQTCDSLMSLATDGKIDFSLYTNLTPADFCVDVGMCAALPDSICGTQHSRPLTQKAFPEDFENEEIDLDNPQTIVRKPTVTSWNSGRSKTQTDSKPTPINKPHQDAYARARQKAQAQAKERYEAVNKAREEAQVKARMRQEAEYKARREAQENARKRQEAELQAYKDAQIKARQEAYAQAKAREEAQIKARQEAYAQAKAREEAQVKARQEAYVQARAREEAEMKARQEAALQANRGSLNNMHNIAEVNGNNAPHSTNPVFSQLHPSYHQQMKLRQQQEQQRQQQEYRRQQQEYQRQREFETRQRELRQREQQQREQQRKFVNSPFGFRNPMPGFYF